MTGRGRSAAPALAAICAACIIATLLATSTLGATARRVWHANVGGYGASGSATLLLDGTLTGSFSVTMRGLKPSTTYAQMLYTGTCGHPLAVVKLSGLRSDASGAASRSLPLNAAAGTDVWGTAYYHALGIRIATGSEAHCAVLTFRVATRIAVPKYGIDLPVVKQIGSAYPLCNVALYPSSLSQPGEAGLGLIFAHARTGMFLPLLNASLVNNGTAMVGAAVSVWMSDSTLLTYRITRVLRHTYVLPSASSSSEHLYLQTSEGPNGTANKLLLELSRNGSSVAPYAAAHPTPHPVICF
jgi:hypothetical protein